MDYMSARLGGNRQTFGEWLRGAMLAAGVRNQTDLAERVGVTSSAVNTWVRDRRKPDISMAEPLAKALGLQRIDVLLATDSATTLIDGDGSVANVYNSGNKLFNLVKGWPIGATTWGAGSIGLASMATLAKDLRRRLSGKDFANPSWRLEPDSYTIREVAERAREFLYDELYLPAHSGIPPERTPLLGFCVAGYSAGAALPEIWTIEMGEGGDPAP